MDKPADLPGRYVKKGEVLGYVVGEYVPLVRVVVPQPQVDHVRLATRGVDILMPQDLTQTWSANLIRAVPKAAKELPSPALGKSGGGKIVVDPGDKQGVKAVESLFEFELALPAGDLGHYLGSRVHVRFEHAPEPLGWRAWRDLRRLFLSQFHV
jgi:putative peptide zinc metalloprotease protein